MKKIILSLFFPGVLAFGTNVLHAQCNITSVFTSSKTLYLDSTNTIVRTEDENTTIEINKTEIIISPGNESGRTMKGVFISNACNWKVPFKEGKTVIKTVIADPGDDPGAVTITIEGKAGVVSLMVTIDKEPNKRIKVIADKFEEKK
ncbi:hypothetical protein [Flavitalea sp.]|nr:hypothetical protein [Flavitalea sp.]